jgi:AraC-like DNA-binding protein
MPCAGASIAIPSDAAADHFFSSIAIVCAELAASPEQFWLPRARSQELSCAMDYILNHLDSRLSVGEISQAINVSQRTLARRFVEEAHLSCGRFIRRIRMLRAMELLAERDSPVIEVSHAVGFDSVSAFNAGFRRFTHDTPSEYRKRFLPR